MSKENCDDTCEDCDDCKNTQNIGKPAKNTSLEEDDLASIKKDSWPIYIAVTFVTIIVLAVYMAITY